MPGARGDLKKRLWAKVAIPRRDLPFDHSVNRDACWPWTGATSKKRRNQRRPTIRLGGRGTANKLVARVVCEWFHGPPPTGAHEAGHTCPKGENCLCVNPHHLQWMTRVENERYKHDPQSCEVVQPESEGSEGGAAWRGHLEGAFDSTGA